MLTAGECSITARQTGNVNNNNALPVTRTFNVVAGAQTISFTDPVDADFSEESQVLTASASSGLTVTFETLTSSVCTVSDNAVTFVLPGTCTIRASQAGNSNYGAATPVEKSFTITAGVAVIDVADYPDGNWADLSVGDDAFVASAFATSGATVSFESLTTSICTTSGLNGTTITIVGAGTCQITASAPATSNYAAPSPVTLEFTVAKGTQPTLVTVASPDHIAIAVTSGTTTLSTTGGAGGGAVTYSLVSGANCSVGGAGGNIVTATAATTCVVKATKAADSNYNEATSANLSITVGVQPRITSGTAAVPTGTKSAGQTITGQLTTGNWTGTPTPVLTYTWFICTSASTSTTFTTTETVSGCTEASGVINNTNRTYVLPSPLPSSRWWRMRITATVTINGTAYRGYAWTQTK
jgi:hypothetical protein